MKPSEMQTDPMGRLTLKAEPEILDRLIEWWNAAPVRDDEGKRLVMEAQQSDYEARLGEVELRVTRVDD
jgi:hypothetical protein